jgi:UDP-2,3-diacylglucosamine pyrophosphatase LpxH
MILIADSHINPDKGNDTEFFEMLRHFEKTTDDLVFLGDIFDLWIALPRYESDIHVRFLSWCEKQKAQRTVGFIEGNHEFFLARRWAYRFSWCTDASWYRDGKGNLFAHGDRINREDRNYLLFRRLTKNGVSQSVIRHMPFGPRLAAWVKRKLKHTNLMYRGYLPEEEILHFAGNQFDRGVEKIFLGHFHTQWSHALETGKEVFILPPWLNTGIVTRVADDAGPPLHLHWSQIDKE